MRFTRLALQNWRNFSSVDIALQDRAFFVGPNASGKSNLLDAFRFLHDLVSVGGGLGDAVERRGGVKSIRSLASKRNPEIVLNVDIGTSDNPQMWGYRLCFSDDKKSKTKRPIVVSEDVYVRGENIFNRPGSDDEGDPERLTQTAIEQTTANKEFRPIAEFLASIRYLHVVPQVVRDPRRSVGAGDPFGGDLLERINAATDKTRRGRLGRMNKALKTVVPQLGGLELEIDKKGVPHLKAKFTHWRASGAWQNEERFSDGTLRLLGLLWALQEKGGPLLLEEPELSLHDEVSSHLPKLLEKAQSASGRQALITTHSNALLNDPGIGLDEVHRLEPSENGTIVETAEDSPSLTKMVNAGVPVGEAVIPLAAPAHASELAQADLFR